MIFCSALIAYGCSSKGVDITAIAPELLVVTAGPIPIALEHKLSDQEVQRLKRHYPKTLERIRNYRPLLIQDVINMTRAGISDKVVIHEIHVTRSSFYLTPKNRKFLEQSGVSKRVIDEMIDTIDNHH